MLLLVLQVRATNHEQLFSSQKDLMKNRKGKSNNLTRESVCMDIDLVITKSNDLYGDQWR